MHIKVSDLIEKIPDLLSEETPIVRITCYIGNGRVRLLSNAEIVQQLLTALSGKLSYDAKKGLWSYHQNSNKYMTTRFKVRTFINKIMDLNNKGCNFSNTRGREIVRLLEQAAFSALDIFQVFIVDCCNVEKGESVKAAELYACHKIWCEEHGRPVPNRGSVSVLVRKSYYHSYRRDGELFYVGFTLNNK